MATDTWANKYRPKKFSDVVGQGNEVAILRKITSSPDKPNAVMLTGPFGTGKTTCGRLLARALLCTSKVWSKEQLEQPEAERGTPLEPCGVCEDCKAIDRENHPNYTEVDAASQNSVADVRTMKEMLAYRSGDRTRIVCYDESHMLSIQAQNALLQTLEEGNQHVLFVFCTTASNKMLPTVKSRCVELQMKLLTQNQIAARLAQVCDLEKVAYEEKALKVLATYVKGHARDALVMVEQLARMDTSISEELVRRYLKLDRYEEVYKLLVERDRKKGVEALEELLCTFAPAELATCIGETLLNTYKLHIGIDNFAAFEKIWLKRILDERGPDNLLAQAEAVLTLHTDFATIAFATVTLANVLLGEKAKSHIPPNSLRPGGEPQPATATVTPMQFRKPGR